MVVITRNGGLTVRALHLLTQASCAESFRRRVRPGNAITVQAFASGYTLSTLGAAARLRSTAMMIQGHRDTRRQAETRLFRWSVAEESNSPSARSGSKDPGTASDRTSRMGSGVKPELPCGGQKGG